MTTTNTKTMISVKLDKSLKLAAQETAKEIGISLGTLINSFLKQFVRDKEVNFSVAERPNAALREAIRQSDLEYEKGNYKVAHSGKELLDQLRS